MAADRMYINPVEGNGNLATGCGAICSRVPGVAKDLLLDYLKKLRANAIADFIEYGKREQNEIHNLGNVDKKNRRKRVKHPITGRMVRDGFKKFHKIGPFLPRKPTLCPKNTCGEQRLFLRDDLGQPI